MTFDGPYPLKREIDVFKVAHPAHETTRECVTCHQTVLVAGMIDDLPERYRCLDCREQTDERAVDLGAAIDRARKAAGVA